MPAKTKGKANGSSINRSLCQCTSDNMAGRLPIRSTRDISAASSAREGTVCSKQQKPSSKPRQRACGATSINTLKPAYFLAEYKNRACHSGHLEFLDSACSFPHMELAWFG